MSKRLVRVLRGVVILGRNTLSNLLGVTLVQVRQNRVPVQPLPLIPIHQNAVSIGTIITARTQNEKRTS